MLEFYQKHFFCYFPDPVELEKDFLQWKKEFNLPFSIYPLKIDKEQIYKIVPEKVEQNMGPFFKELEEKGFRLTFQETFSYFILPEQ